MKIKISEVNSEAKTKLPPNEKDGSMIGINYADLYIDAMNVELEDGRKVTCTRKGLNIIFSIGDQHGEALMRRIENGPDPQNILQCALAEAAQAAGATFSVENDVIYLDA